MRGRKIKVYRMLGRKWGLTYTSIMGVCFRKEVMCNEHVEPGPPSTTSGWWKSTITRPAGPSDSTTNIGAMTSRRTREEAAPPTTARPTTGPSWVPVTRDQTLSTAGTKLHGPTWEASQPSGNEMDTKPLRLKGKESTRRTWCDGKCIHPT